MGGYEQFLPLALFGVVAAIAAATFVWRSQQERKRRQAMAAAAQRLGLSFEDFDYSLAAKEFAAFRLFSQGSSKTFQNILRCKPDGTAGAMVFDYHYTTGSGKNRRTHSQTVAVLCAPKAGLPRFELRPESVFHKIGTIFGYQDIDFESSPAFSKSYLLRGQDEPAIRNLFGLNLLQYFEAHPGWCVEGGGSWIAAYRHGRLVEPEALPNFLDELKLLLWAFPR